MLGAYWLAMALPNEYSSYATVLVEPQAVSPQLVKAGVSSSDLNERLHLMTAQILSRPRLSLLSLRPLRRKKPETRMRWLMISRRFCVDTAPEVANAIGKRQAHP